MKSFPLIAVAIAVCSSTALPQTDPSLDHASLQDCISFALTHQPAVHEASLDVEIADHFVKSKIADWLPQVSFNGTVQHTTQLQTSFAAGNMAKVGLENSATGQFYATQTLFNRDVLLAGTTAGAQRELYRNLATGSKIDLVIAVSKAYYATLVTRQQIGILDEDILRLERALKDSYAQYQAGVVDKTDFKRATITLNNVRAQRLQAANFLKVRYMALKEQMGYPAESPLEIQADSSAWHEALVDTTRQLRVEDRIEYQVLSTRKRLQESNLSYSWWSFLPSLSAFGSYSLNYQNNDPKQLFTTNYPYSGFGLQLSFPIFESGKRIQQIKMAQLEVERIDFELSALRSALSTQYVQVLSAYKSNVNNYLVSRDNVELAREVYRTIQLQYKAGTKSYLDLIIAETDLRAAEDNQVDAFYQVLTSKLDLQRALGTIEVQ
jgi:outer membrane protein TolC